MNDVPAIHPDALRYAERNVAQDVIQKILVVVDPTARAHPAIEKAARLAASFASTLELLIFDVDQQLPESWAGGTTAAQYRDLMRERYRGDLEALAAPLRAKGLSVVTTSHKGLPLDQSIVEHAIRSQADLVVKDTHTSAASINWTLIRHMPMPLLMVRAAPWPSRPRIAVSVDPCHGADRPVALDEKIMTAGSCFSRALAGELEVLHVLQSPPHLAGDTVTAQMKEQSHARDRASIDRLVGHHHPAVERPIRYLEKRIPEGILELVASAQPTVLVIGSAGRPRFQGSTASTAAHVLEHTSCDLLIVKPPGFISPVLVTDE
ncbi:MAG: universal stress protein [Gammaproteobacteria bacterium]